MDDNLEEDFNNMQELLNALITKMVDIYGPEAVAAILMMNSISLYNSFLDVPSYKSMMKSIYKEALRFCEPEARILH